MISAAAQMKYRSTQGLEPDVAALAAKANRIFSPAGLLRPFTTLSALSCNKLNNVLGCVLDRMQPASQ